MTPARAAALLLALCASACTDAALQPTPPPDLPRADNRLRLVGEVCTEPADVTPFPVKILFLLDQSASLQCTDSRNRRFDALNQVIGALRPLPNVWFGFVGFASWSRAQTFTRNDDEIRPFLDPGGGLGPATDYQGTLATAVRLLEQDMVAAGPAVRARTRYVVVFMSDGIPEPRCLGGCEDDSERCGDGVDNDADGSVDAADPDCANIGDNAAHPDNLYGVCNTDREIAEDTYVDMQGRCPEYNQPRQILQRVDDLRTLEAAYAVGDVQLHTVLLFSSPEVVASLCPDASAAFGYDPERARALLEAMARAGGGTFRDVNLEERDPDFLDFDYASLRSPYWITELLALNLSARPGAAGAPRADSDMDGLADEDETAMGTRRHAANSDGDAGWSDLFEDRLRQRGFDPGDAARPTLDCGSAGDGDGDGLVSCEERYLGTDPRDPDTDGDRIPDGVELRAGTDPLVDDAAEDPDFDGRSNRDEIRGGTDPRAADPDRGRADAVRYALEDRGEQPVPDRETGEAVLRRCYDFDIRDLQLAVTDLPGHRGLNRVLMHAFGQPQGIAGGRAVVRTACVEVLYPGEGKKSPADGVVDLTVNGWQAVHDRIGALLDDVIDCGLAARAASDPEAPLPRPELLGLVERCLPLKVPVDGFLFPREEMVELLGRYFDADLRPLIPAVPSDLFWPIESFDPAAHCHRPWEIARLEALLRVVVAACEACEPEAAPDAGPPDAADAQ